MTRLLAACGACLLLAGCVTTRTTECPPGAELPKAEKARAAKAYREFTDEEKAAVGPLVRFVDRIERTCAAIAGVR